MATFVKVICIDTDDNIQEWDDQNNDHGRYDPDDTTTIRDLKKWISHECKFLRGEKVKKLEIAFAGIDGYETANDDNTLLWSFIFHGSNGPLPNDDDRMETEDLDENTQLGNFLQTIDVKPIVLYVWRREESFVGRVIDLFGGPTEVKIKTYKKLKIICPKPGRTARQFYTVEWANENLIGFDLTSASRSELFLFIEDPVLSPTEPNKGLHRMVRFKIPRTTKQILVEEDPKESTESKGTFTLSVKVESVNAQGVEIKKYEDGIRYSFEDTYNLKRGILETYVLPIGKELIVPIATAAMGIPA